MKTYSESLKIIKTHIKKYKSWDQGLCQLLIESQDKSCDGCSIFKYLISIGELNENVCNAPYLVEKIVKDLTILSRKEKLEKLLK